eukprot:CAMPEP_0169307648 /NCGR_PEP_ID=MMETSP1017-20121227/1414_1 /TAXON_ID=342587 /ORGANISM="Karlodinium micrum, Strain CCMP2283" /LENGTH=86 /DNA_ID=CAMNT_0009400969 /DNA_START=155 /DNA_END=416 /DNA_ORIENTATION=-
MPFSSAALRDLSAALRACFFDCTYALERLTEEATEDMEQKYFAFALVLLIASTQQMRAPDPISRPERKRWRLAGATHEEMNPESVW